jgi:hypothetical protein
VRRLLEYEQMKLAAQRLADLPQYGRDFLRAQVYVEQALAAALSRCAPAGPAEAWRDILKRAKLVQHHKISREELSVREHMSIVLRHLQGRKFVEFGDLFDPPGRAGAGGDLHRHAGAGQGNADRADPGRSLCPSTCGWPTPPGKPFAHDRTQPHASPHPSPSTSSSSAAAWPA